MKVRRGILTAFTNSSPVGKGKEKTMHVDCLALGSPSHHRPSSLQGPNFPRPSSTALEKSSLFRSCWNPIPALPLHLCEGSLSLSPTRHSLPWQRRSPNKLERSLWMQHSVIIVNSARLKGAPGRGRNSPPKPCATFSSLSGAETTLEEVLCSGHPVLCMWMRSSPPGPHPHTRKGRCSHEHFWSWCQGSSPLQFLSHFLTLTSGKAKIFHAGRSLPQNVSSFH